MAVDRVAAGLLQLGVDRRVDLEPALADGVDAVLLDQLVLDEVEEVGLADLASTCRERLSCEVRSGSASRARLRVM